MTGIAGTAWAFSVMAPPPAATASAAGADASPGRALAAFLETLAENARPEAFDAPSGAWSLALPRDHGAHEAAEAEAWSIAAHLTGEDGQLIGLHFALSRFALQPAAAADPARWRVDALHRGHAALTQEGADAILAEERFRRPVPGPAGGAPQAAALRLDEWSLTLPEPEGEAALALSATIGEVAISLRLTASQPALQLNAAGSGPFRGYALPVMAVRGEIRRADRAEPVEGLAWLDHLWGALPAPGGPVAYDRLSAHLDDGSALSLVRTRRRDGRGSATADGTLIAADGSARALSAAGVRMDPLETAGRPPLSWQISGEGLDLVVAPLIDDPELPVALPVWTGLVTIEGRKAGLPVSGTGTLHLTGYAAR